MKGFRFEGENGNYKALPVNIYDANGELLDDDSMEGVWIYDDAVEKLYAVVYNGRLYYPIFESMEELEEEFDDKVVKALKKDGCFHEIEYSDDPDDDDEVVDIRLLVFNV